MAINFVSDNMPNAYRINEVWEWVIAFDAFDYGDSQPLDILIRTKAVPEEFRPIIADIISARRRPKTKARSKIPPADRMKLAMHLSIIHGLVDTLSRGPVGIGEYQGMSGLEMVADREGVEVIEIRRQMEKKKRDVVQMAADEFGVTTEAIEELLRVMRKKMNSFPNV